MTSRITKQKATIYLAAGRRHFRKAACYNTLARAFIRDACDCSVGDHETPGECCWYHETSAGEYYNLKFATVKLTAIFRQAEREGWEDSVVNDKWVELLEAECARQAAPADVDPELANIPF